MTPTSGRLVDYKALRLLTERSSGSDLGKKILLKKIDKAWKEGRLDFNNQETDWKWRMCNARMMMGYYSDYSGWEYRADWAANAWVNRAVPGPMWDGEKTEKLYILGEQGIGDEVLFSQCIRDAIEVLGHRNIVFETEPRLIPIMERSFGIECTGRKKLTDPDRPGMTAWICLGDLLRFFRTGAKWGGNAYLKPDPKRVKEFEWARGKTCISWYGRHGRYDPQEFIKIVGKGIDVQYNETCEDLIQPGIDKKDDIEGLFALLSVTKLVSVSTSVVHFAASMGSPVDLVLAPPETGPNHDQLQWRWGLDVDKSPWYDSVTIYRTMKQYASVLMRNARKSSRLRELRSRSEVASHP